MDSATEIDPLIAARVDGGRMAGRYADRAREKPMRLDPGVVLCT